MRTVKDIKVCMEPLPLSDSSANIVTSHSSRRIWVWMVGGLAALGLLAAGALVGLQDQSILPGSIMSSVANAFGNSGQSKSTGFVASVKDALGLIADRSPGARQGGQLINKPAKLASLEGRYRTNRDHNAEPNGRGRVRNRLIPSRAPPAAHTVPGVLPLQIADLLPQLGTADASPSRSLVPAGLTLPSSGSSGGGFFSGPGPVFIGGGGMPGPTAVIPPPPLVVIQPGPVTAVPEPATWIMFIVGVAAIAHSMRRRAKKQRRSTVLSLRGEAAAV